MKTKNHLLELVKPEIELLSPLWLAALRDRALIELPSEFSPQLPREGGAFFSNDTKDVVRPFYADAWAPILFASAICVSTLPDLIVKAEPEDRKIEIKLERFHLVFGNRILLPFFLKENNLHVNKIKLNLVFHYRIEYGSTV